MFKEIFWLKNFLSFSLIILINTSQFRLKYCTQSWYFIFRYFFRLIFSHIQYKSWLKVIIKMNMYVLFIDSWVCIYFWTDTMNVFELNDKDECMYQLYTHILPDFVDTKFDDTYV